MKSAILLSSVLAVSVYAQPKPAVDLKPGTHRYEAKISLGQQSLALKTTTTIREEGGAWLVTETAETPMGNATDTSVLEKGTLILRKRSVRQGPLVIDIEQAGNKVTGTINVNGKERAVNMELGAPLFADGAAAFDSIGCLPLADGYTATYRNFDLQQGKEKVFELKVAGVESISIAAGKFEAFKVEIVQAEGGGDKATLWIAKDTRVPVKISAEMGGAMVSSELLR